jgi:hypothetical protein
MNKSETNIIIKSEKGLFIRRKSNETGYWISESGKNCIKKHYNKKYIYAICYMEKGKVFTHVKFCGIIKEFEIKKEEDSYLVKLRYLT